MTIRLMTENMLRTETYHYIKAVRIEFQPTNGKKGAYFVFLTTMKDEEFAVQWEPSEEIIDVWND